MSKVAENRQKLKAMSLDELNTELLSLRKQQFILRLKRKTEGTLEKTHHVTEIRKQIARIKTLMTDNVGESHGS
jgi:large subunit ribosomal protein L29